MTQVTDLNSWLEPDTFRIRLDSGMEVTVKKTDVSHMMKTGHMPQPYQLLLAEQEYKAEHGLLKPEDIYHSLDFQHWMVQQTLVEPALSIAQIQRIPKKDLEQLFFISQGELSPKTLLATNPVKEEEPAGE